MDPGNVIYLGTVSKTFSPGVRVGWALAEQSVIQRLVLAKEAADLCGSSFTMLMTERYFAGERWRENLTTFVDLYRSRRDAMLEALPEHFPPIAGASTALHERIRAIGSKLRFLKTVFFLLAGSGGLPRSLLPRRGLTLR